MGIPKTSPSQSGFAPWPPSFGVGGWGRLRSPPGSVDELREGAVGVVVDGEEMEKAAAEAGFVVAHGDKLRRLSADLAPARPRLDPAADPRPVDQLRERSRSID